MEHRWGRRIAVDVPVRLVLSPSAVIWGRVRNVSMTGAFLQSAQPLAAGALVSIESTSGARHWPACALEATVIWTRAEGAGLEGAGLEWCEPMDSAPWGSRDIRAPWGVSLDSYQIAAHRDVRRA